MTDWLLLLLQSLGGILVAYLSAIWAVRGALRERWWERKFHAYCEILEALHHIVWYSEALKDSYEMMEHASNDPKAAERRERYLDAQLAIRKAMDIGPFIISGNAATILKQLRTQTASEDSEAPPDVILAAHCQDYRVALEEIRNCAQQDLGNKWERE